MARLIGEFFERSFLWQRRGELGDVGHAHAGFDGADLFDRLVKAVFGLPPF